VAFFTEAKNAKNYTLLHLLTQKKRTKNELVLMCCVCDFGAAIQMLIATYLQQLI